MLKNLKLTSGKRKVETSQVHICKIRMLKIPKLAWTKRNVEKYKLAAKQPMLNNESWHQESAKLKIASTQLENQNVEQLT